MLGIEPDIVVIDCPPRVGTTPESAVAIADLVLIPVFPSAADLIATTAALELVQRAMEARRDGGPRYMLVPSRVDRRTSAGREIEAALKKLRGRVSPSIGSARRSSMPSAPASGSATMRRRPLRRSRWMRSPRRCAGC